jgi:streptogramin lyase
MSTRLAFMTSVGAVAFLTTAKASGVRTLSRTASTRSGEQMVGAYHRLKQPTGLAIDANGLLWIANAGRGTLLVYDDLRLVYKDRIVLPQNAYPAGLYVDISDRLLVADFNRSEVLIYVSRNLAQSIPSPGPSGVAADGGGNVFVVNVLVKTLWIYDSQGFTLKTVPLSAGAWSAAIFGQTLFLSLSSNEIISYNIPQLLSGSPSPSLFAKRGVANPSDLAIDSSGQVYVANMAPTARNVTKYSPQGKLLQTFQPQGNEAVRYEGVAVDASGNVYISNQFPLNNVTVYNAAGTLIATLM